MRFLALTALLVAAVAAEDVELTFQPPGNGGQYPAGTYVGITCKVKTDIFDLTQVVKVDASGTEYEISTNDFLADSFKDTERYSLMSSTTGDQNEYKVTRISIRDLRGADSGTIECRHILLNSSQKTATEAFKVIVPPQSVEILHYDTGVSTPVADGADIVLREGDDHGVICRVRIVDSADSPTVAITLGGDDILSTFSKEEEKTTSGEPGLIQYDNTVYYEWLTAMPDINHNGKTLTCSASMPGFEARPLSKSVNLIVHYAPRLECDEARTQQGARTNITCRAQMFPEVELASVSWARAPSIFTLTLDDPVHERHELIMTKKNDDSYEFVVSINEVMEGDFGMYDFEVQNSHSPGELQVELVEVASAPTPEPGPEPAPETTPEVQTEPPNPDPTEDNEREANPPYDPIRAGPSTGGATAVTSQVLSLLLLIVVYVFH